MHVILVHDNALADKAALEKLGVVVESASDGADAKVASGRHDLIIFDIDHAKTDALASVQKWRRGHSQAHLIVLGSSLPLPARVNFLNAGADCCLLKPNHLPELLARVRGLARRSNHFSDQILRILDLEIDMSSRMVRRSGRAISLTPREYSLLRYLALHKGELVSRAMILDHVYAGREESNVINVYIRYLRNKIDRGFGVPLILTRYGRGYMLRSETTRDHDATSPLLTAG